jgi:hypothetical protein
MPKKLVQKQKQKQRQSVVVNVNLAKARARASAKKSRGKKSSVMMLPAPIYASPINNLIPAMYGNQGQQIQPKSTEELLKTFLSKAEPAPVKTWSTLGGESSLSSLGAFKSLGSVPSKISSSSSDTPDWVSELSTPSVLSSYKSISTPSTKSPNSSMSSEISRPLLSDEYEAINPLTGKKQRYLKPMSDPFSSDIPTPFQNEERTYLKASEPDNEANAPKFSDKAPTSIYDTLDRLEARTLSDINNLLEPRRPDRRPPVRVQLDEEASLSSVQDPLNPFPQKMYNKMMGYF